MGPERIAGPEDASDPWMALEHLAQPLGQDLELLDPAKRGLQVQVDLGQDTVKDQVLEQLFVANVMVQGAGDDPEAGGQAAHGQGLGAVLGDDGQRFLDDAFAGELAAAVLAVAGQVEPEGTSLSVGGSAAGGGRCWRAGCGRRRFIPLPDINLARVVVHDASEVHTYRQGDADTAGFVQVIQGHTDDLERTASLGGDQEELLAREAPHILAVTVAEHADRPGDFTQIVYFTSERDARQFEPEPPPEAHEPAQEQRRRLITNLRCFDLRDPQLLSPAVAYTY